MSILQNTLIFVRSDTFLNIKPFDYFLPDLIIWYKSYAFLSQEYKFKVN